MYNFCGWRDDFISGVDEGVEEGGDSPLTSSLISGFLIYYRLSDPTARWSEWQSRLFYWVYQGASTASGLQHTYAELNGSSKEEKKNLKAKQVAMAERERQKIREM